MLELELAVGWIPIFDIYCIHHSLAATLLAEVGRRLLDAPVGKECT